jgi:hypothetical protein
MQGEIRIAPLHGAAWRRLRASLVVAALVASGMAAPSSLQTVGAQTQKVIRDDLVKKLTGKKIRLDKQTGQPRAVTEAEARATVEQLTGLLQAPANPPQVTYRRDGTQVATIDGYFNRTIVARPRANGTFETKCVTTLDEAVAFLSGESAAFEDR